MWDLVCNMIWSCFNNADKQRYTIYGVGMYVPKTLYCIIERYIIQNFYGSAFECVVNEVFIPSVRNFNLAKYLCEFQPIIVKVTNHYINDLSK